MAGKISMGARREVVSAERYRFAKRAGEGADHRRAVRDDGLASQHAVRALRQHDTGPDPPTAPPVAQKDTWRGRSVNIGSPAAMAPSRVTFPDEAIRRGNIRSRNTTSGDRIAGNASPDVATVRAVFDKRSTLCLCKPRRVPERCERRPRCGRSRHVRSLLGTELV
jgi:hypothetical protein